MVVPWVRFEYLHACYHDMVEHAVPQDYLLDAEEDAKTNRVLKASAIWDEKMRSTQVRVPDFREHVGMKPVLCAGGVAGVRGVTCDAGDEKMHGMLVHFPGRAQGKTQMVLEKGRTVNIFWGG